VFVMIKSQDPTSALSEPARAELAGREPVAEPRLVEVDARTVAEARAKVELAEGDVIAWVRY
jgi:plastocyanin